MDDLKKMIEEFQARGGEVREVPTGRRSMSRHAMKMAVMGLEPDARVDWQTGAVIREQRAEGQ